MWKKFWQWFQGLLRWVFGRSRKIQVPQKQQKNVRPLFYQNYEFLFLRLLEGVAGGWQEQQALEFMAEWENRTTEADWIAWLHSFGERTLSSKSPNVELGRRMLLLSQIGCGELGIVAGEFGDELLRRYSQNKDILNTPDATPNYPDTTPPETEDIVSEIMSENHRQTEVIYFENIRKKERKFIHNKTDNKRNIETGYIAKNNVVEPIGKSEENAPKIPPLARTLKDPTTQTKPLYASYYKSEMVPTSLDSLEGVLAMLQDNAGMVKQLARQMGIQTINPQLILRELEVRAWMQEGLKYQNAGDLSMAIACCDRALSLKPDYQIGWAMRGDGLFKLERYEMAVASYNRATELKPDDWEAWYNQGMTLFKLSRLIEAVDSFQQSLKLKPDFAQTWKNLAIALFNLKLYSEAIASCEEALKIEPQDQLAITCRENARTALRHQDDV